VLNKVHETWHDLFFNWTPFEVAVFMIQQCLCEEGWEVAAEFRCRWEEVKYRYLVKRGKELGNIPRLRPMPTKQSEEARKEMTQMVFGPMPLPLIISEVITRWAPTGYFRHWWVKIKTADGETFEFTSQRYQKGSS